MRPDRSPNGSASSAPARPVRRTRRGPSWLSRFGLVAAVSGLLLQSVGPAFAQGGRPPPRRPAATAGAKAPVSGKVDLQVMVVHGTDSHARIDASLKPIMKHLRYMPHKGYTLLSQADHDLGVGGHHGFPLAGGRRLDVKLISVDASQAKIRVEVYQGKVRKMESVLAVHRNKAFLITGPKHDNGELILAITPRY